MKQAPGHLAAGCRPGLVRDDLAETQTHPPDRTAGPRDGSTASALRRQLEQTSLLLDVVGHDVLSGVTAIAGYTELLGRSVERDWSDDERERFVARITSNVRRITHIVANVVDLAQEGAGAVVVRRSRTNLAELIASVLEDLDLNGHPVDVFVEQLFGFVDPFIAARILENLVTNSVTHTPPGTQIVIAVAAVPSGVQLTVADNGDGVPPDLHAMLFDRRRLARWGDHPGTGLGLSIVKRFSELHGGDAWIAGGCCGTVLHVLLSGVDSVKLRRPAARAGKERPTSAVTP